MSQIQFTNLWTKKPASYDPETEGVYAYAFKPGCDGKLTENTGVSLGYGYISNPHYSLSAAVAGYVAAIARFPEIADRLEMYKVPCIFSSPDGWVKVDFIIPEEMRSDAERVYVPGREPFFPSVDNYRHKWDNRDAEVKRPEQMATHNFEIIDVNATQLVSVESPYDCELAWKDAVRQYASEKDFMVIDFSAECSGDCRIATVDTGSYRRTIYVRQVLDSNKKVA